MERRFGNLAVIGQVSPCAKPVPVDLCLSVNQNNRLESHAEYLDWPVNGPEFELRQAAELVVGVENISKHLAQKGRRIGARIKRQLLRFVAVAQGPQIVDEI